jgi:hypothetical protein
MPRYPICFIFDLVRLVVNPEPTQCLPVPVAYNPVYNSIYWQPAREREGERERERCHQSYRVINRVCWNQGINHCCTFRLGRRSSIRNLLRRDNGADTRQGWASTVLAHCHPTPAGSIPSYSSNSRNFCARSFFSSSSRFYRDAGFQLVFFVDI